VDLTPQTLREVEFREKLRGYHPDDVDDFLEQAALALEGLLARLRAAEAVASATGGQATGGQATGGQAVAPGPVAVSPDIEPVSAETLHRTLLLAQRTADAAVAEAEESARRMVESAREEAERIVSEAEGKAATAAKDARAKAEAAIADLDQRRSALEREVTSLQGWASQQRDRLREVLTDQVRALDIWLATSGTPKPAAPRTSLVNAPGPGPVAAADDHDQAEEADSPAADRG
jgi:cell division initiation protein